MSTSQNRETSNQETYMEQLRRLGQLGSRLDFTWNGKKHICCASHIHYYHRKGCKACTVGMNGELAELYELEQQEKKNGRYHVE